MNLQPLSSAASGLPPTAQLVLDLQKVRYLLTTLTNLPAHEAEDVDDIAWLRERQRFLRSILALRAALRRRKVVDLAQWRGGNTAASDPLAHVA